MLGIDHSQSDQRTEHRSVIDQLNRRSCWRCWLLIATFVCFLTGQTPKVHAEFIISIDFDPVAAGIQDSLTVAQGDSFTAYIVLQFNDSNGLDSYRFSLGFDDSAMTVDSVLHNVPVGYSVGLAGPPVVTGPTIAPFNADSNVIFNGPTTIAATIVGTINFMAGMTPGVFAITPYEDALFDMSFNNSAQPIVPTMSAGSLVITAVPEPTTCIFLGSASGLLFQYHYRRRRLRKLTK